MLGILVLNNEDRIKVKENIMEPLTTESILIFAYILILIGSMLSCILCLICSNCSSQEKKADMIFNLLFKRKSAILEVNPSSIRVLKMTSSDKMLPTKKYGQPRDSRYQLYKKNTAESFV